MEHTSPRTCTISHLPAEILHDIFGLVLSTWLLPGDGNHLIDDLWLLQCECISHKEYLRVEDAWKLLRSTCRQWCHLLKGYTVPIATTNLKFYTYPKPVGSPILKRLETYSKGRCWTRCNKMCGSRMVENETGYQASTRQDEEVRRWNISANFSQIESLRVFIHHSDRDLRNDLGLLVAFYHAPLLRALSIHTSLYNPANPIPLSLTHLHLVGPLNALPQLQLPLLKFLHLSIERPPEIWGYLPSTPFSFHSWVLPLLLTLRLNGKVVEAEGELVQELVLKCSQTMVNLVLDLQLIIPDSYFNRIAAPLSIVYPVLHLCPRLAVLGLSMSFLTHSTPIPRLPPPLPSYTLRENHSQPSARSLSLLILGMGDFDELDSKNRDKFDDKLTNSGMLSIFGREEVGYTPWSLARVTIPYTWSELGTFWDERHRVEMQDSHRSGPLHFYHPAEPAWAFLSHFIRKKLDIFDADGVELHAETGGGMALFKPFM